MMYDFIVLLDYSCMQRTNKRMFPSLQLIWPKFRALSLSHDPAMKQAINSSEMALGKNSESSVGLASLSSVVILRTELSLCRVLCTCRKKNDLLTPTRQANAAFPTAMSNMRIKDTLDLQLEKEKGMLFEWWKPLPLRLRLETRLPGEALPAIVTYRNSRKQVSLIFLTSLHNVLNVVGLVPLTSLDKRGFLHTDHLLLERKVLLYTALSEVNPQGALTVFGHTVVLWELILLHGFCYKCNLKGLVSPSRSPFWGLFEEALIHASHQVATELLCCTKRACSAVSVNYCKVETQHLLL